MAGIDETRASPLEREDRGAISSQVSREIVQVHARLYGRGPTKAKTFVQDEFILCVLEDVYTPAERTLVAAGSAAEVKASRHAFQEAVAEQFIEIVERAAGRRVRVFLSQVSNEPEVSAELFMMEPYPASTDGASASTDGASASTDGASASTDGASASTDGASASTDGASASMDGGPATDGAGRD